MESNEVGVLIASAEFALKSSPVRRSLEQRLMDDLRSALTNAGFREPKIEKRSARILVRALSDPAKAASILSKIFGVAYAAPVDIVPARMDDVLRALVDNANESLSFGDSFAIRSRHSKISKLSHREIEIKGGAQILRALAERNVVVNLKEPDVLISVDIVDELVLIYRRRMMGPGGLPLSSRWKMLAVLDSGPFSILAAYSMMRRGCLVQLLVPASSYLKGYGREAQLTLAKKLGVLVPRSQYCCYLINLDSVRANSDASILPWRMAVRSMGEHFAIKSRFHGIIFSDRSGDISGITNSRYHLPIFYPLIGLGYDDIEALCDLAGVSKQELDSYLASEHENNCSITLDRDQLENFIVEKVRLGPATGLHDGIAC